MLRKRTLLLVVALASALPLVAAESARVSGKIIADGKPLKFTYAYAIAKTPLPGGEASYHVLFSDVAISDKDLAVFPDFAAVNENKLHGMRVVLDSHGAIESTEIYDVSGSTEIKDDNKLELTTFNAETIAGRLHLDKPYKDYVGGTYDYDLKFSARIRQESDLNQ